MRNHVDIFRERVDPSQGELATTVGVSRQTINPIERDRYDPSLELAVKLARYFECLIKALFDPDIDSVGE